MLPAARMGEIGLYTRHGRAQRSLMCEIPFYYLLLVEYFALQLRDAGLRLGEAAFGLLCAPLPVGAVISYRLVTDRNLYNSPFRPLLKLALERLDDLHSQTLIRRRG